MTRLFQREVDEPIIDEIDGFSIQQQAAAFEAKSFRSGYRRRIASTCQHLPCEDELRIEILFLRLVIDNGDPPQRAIFAMETPLSLEHGADIVPKAPAG